MRTVYAHKQVPSFFNIFQSLEAVACTNPKCERHKGQFEQQKVEFANMSKYRQKKALEEADKTTANIDKANKIALILYDIYGSNALENYLDIIPDSAKQQEDEEEEEGDSQDGGEDEWVDDDSESEEKSSHSE